MKRQFRVLHTPTTVGGNSQTINLIMKEMGIDSESITLKQNVFNYQVDKTLWSQNDSNIVKELKRLFFICNVLHNYDIIHFNFGTTIATPHFPSRNKNNPVVYIFKKIHSVYSIILQKIEIFLYRLFKKIIFVTYQGSDARQGDYCKRNYPIHYVNEAEKNIFSKTSDRGKRAQIKRLDSIAHEIYSLNPDLLNVLPKRAKFMPYASVDVEKIPLCQENFDIEKPVIVHAPSNRSIKGTKYIIEAVEKLKRENLSFDFILVENIENKKAKQIYRTCDLLIDQLLAGFYGALSVEFMALGKPVICYIREEDLCHLPKEMANDFPIINATPESIYNVLKHWLTIGKKDMIKLGLASRNYVEKWHNPRKIVADLLNDYRKHIK